MTVLECLSTPISPKLTTTGESGNSKDNWVWVSDGSECSLEVPDPTRDEDDGTSKYAITELEGGSVPNDGDSTAESAPKSPDSLKETGTVQAPAQTANGMPPREVLKELLQENKWVWDPGMYHLRS